jgi:hypothetical protein
MDSLLEQPFQEVQVEVHIHPPSFVAASSGITKGVGIKLEEYSYLMLLLR